MPITQQRVWSGYRVTGRQLILDFVPRADGISVTVVAQPRTAHGYGVTLNPSWYVARSPEAIKLLRDEEHSHGIMICLQPPTSIDGETHGFYREGFTVALEPGMHLALSTVLPRLFKLAQRIASLDEAIGAPVGARGWMADAIAAVELDGASADDAIAAAFPLDNDPADEQGRVRGALSALLAPSSHAA